MKSLKYLFIPLLIACSASVFAQGGEMQLHLGISGAKTMGDSKDFLPNGSLRGWNFGLMYGFSDKISAGLMVGFQDFFNKTGREVYNTENGHISAVITHSVQTIPIMIAGRYSFNPEASIRPFAGLGIGGNLVSFGEYLGQFGGSDTKIKLAIRPEAGMAYPFGRFKDNAVWLAASYSYLPYNEFDIKDFSQGAISLGITLPMRR